MGYPVHETLPPTPKQVTYARQIASKLHAVIPWESANDRRALSDWISRHQAQLNRPSRGAPAAGATSKQVV